MAVTCFEVFLTTEYLCPTLTESCTWPSLRLQLVYKYDKLKPEIWLRIK